MCCFTAVYIGSVSTAVAQSKYIHGNIKFESESASAIIIIVDDAAKVLGYTQSDKQGNYKLPRPKASSSLYIEVNLYGFEKARRKIEEDTEKYDFYLKISQIALQEVKIKSPPVTQMGDTLSFDVKSFSQEQDITIGDIMRRIPGVEVGEDGTISYNGKKIENLYIHGDDLMGGRYGVATKTIRKELISSVNIIKNHQPVKALQNKILTDNIGIDLVLKDENNLKISGNVLAGAGVPKLYELEASQIVLNKSLKMLNTAGVNNTGKSYENHLKNIGTGGFTGSLSGSIPNIRLSLGDAGAPNIPQIYYLRNQSRFGSLNNMITLKNDLKLRVNITGLNDYNKFESASTVTSFLPEDTLRYFESQFLKNTPRLAEALVNALINKPKYFLSNNTRIRWILNNDFGQMNFNAQAFGQTLDKRAQNISNEFNFIPTLKKNSLLEFRWLLEHNTDAQNLSIGSGYRPTFTADSGQVFQYIKLPTFISNAYVSYKNVNKILVQDYKIGFMSEKQKLHSNLYSDTGNQVVPDPGNSLDWQRRYPYLHVNYQIKTPKNRYDILFPLEFQTVEFRQSNIALNSKNPRLLFNPKISFIHDFTPEKRFVSQYNFISALGDITQIYPGGILLNYRTLTANDPILQSKNTHNASMEYRYEKAIAMLFMNVRASYSCTSSNTLVAWEFDENIQRSKILMLENQQQGYNLSSGLSKFFWTPKFRVSLNGSWYAINYEQLINNRLTPILSSTYNLKASFDKNFFSRISADYIFSASAGISTTKENQDMVSFKNRFTRLEHKASLLFSANKQLLGKISGIQSSTTQSMDSPIRYFFIDLDMNYKTKAKRLEFILNISNLLNQNHFEVYNINANQAISNSYELRGRTTLLKTLFYF